jgi:hypothetical protein
MGKRGPVMRYPRQVWCHLTEEQYIALKREAALLGTTMNDLIREAVDQRLAADAS